MTADAIAAAQSFVEWPSVADLVEQVRSSVRSAAGILAEIRDRDARLRAEHHAYRAYAPDGPAAAAALDARVKAGHAIGRLAGVPIGIKDNILIDGLPAAAGSSHWSMTGPDAEVVRRLRDADAIIVGAQHMHERALGLDAPPVRNAYDPTRHPGGSTAGGGVSVALGTALAAIGTDAGGSIRLPAAVNGCVGLKATRGRISRQGVLPPSTSVDNVGIITRTCADAALIYDVVAGHRPGDSTSVVSPPPEPSSPVGIPSPTLRIGVPVPWLAGLRADISDNLDSARERLRRLGATIVEVDLAPDQDVFDAWLRIGAAEAYTQLASDLASANGGFSAPIADNLAAGGKLTVADLVGAIEMARTWETRVAETYTDWTLDALVLPTSPIPPLPMAELVPERDLASYCRFLAPFNLSGHPAISVPSGKDEDGLPLGIQFVMPHWQEKNLLQLGHLFETAKEMP